MLRENTVFDHHYTLIRQLGIGGFSEVWLAHDSYMDLDVALKIYAPGKGMDASSIDEFRHEIKGVFNLNHTNLLRPTYLGIYEQMPYLVMPYCSKGSATEKIGRMTEEELWKFLHDVASGLAYLHGNDIIHQDIKPANILIDSIGNYVITDFGISTKARSTLRKSVAGGSVSAGTLAYMGPERFTKQPAPTKASDIWSFGAMLYELITGDVPFGEMGGGMQKGGAEIPEISEPISDELRKTIERMLALETWDRPTAEQLVGIVSSRISSSPSNRETQRFVSLDFAKTQPISGRINSEESNHIKESGSPRRWLSILEMVLLTPFLFYNLLYFSYTLSYVLLGLRRLSSLYGILLSVNFILCLSVYYFLFKHAITGDTTKKIWISCLLPAFMAIEVVSEFCLSTDYTIMITVLALVCPIVWFIFQGGIAVNHAEERKKKVFYIVVSVFYFLYIGLTLFSSLTDYILR